MTGSQRQKARSTQTRKPSRAARNNGRPEPTPGEYAREAFSQWTKAVRYAAAAITPVTVMKSAGGPTKSARSPLKERLNPAKTDNAGRLGDMADFVLDKTGGKAGTLASRLSLGSRILEGLRGGKSGSQVKNAEKLDPGGDWAAKQLPIPIQESMEVAIPAKAVYELATRFEDYPEFIDRIEGVESVDDKTAVFDVKVRGGKRSVRIEIMDERPKRRIDWEGTQGLAHSGVVSFHELAPSLTHVELTVDSEPHGLIQRLARTAHLTHHAIRGDMRRFKAWAELAEDVEEPEDLEEESMPREDQEPAGAEGEEDQVGDDEESAYEEDEGEAPEGYEEENLEDDEAAEEDYDGENMEYGSYDDEDEPAPAKAG